MGDGGRDLWHELSGLADAFADLGRRLLHASRRLHAPGALPPQSLCVEMDGLRLAFDAVRAAVMERADGMVVPFAAGAIDTLKDVAALLEAVGDAEQRRDDWAQRMLPALAVLDRVLGLSHLTDPEFAPLAACQLKARALREAIVDSAGNSDDLHAKVDGLADNDHPFAYLVTMAERAEGISDDLWESLFEAVTLAFGKPLAAAAARSRIVLGAVVPTAQDPVATIVVEEAPVALEAHAEAIPASIGVEDLAPIPAPFSAPVATQFPSRSANSIASDFRPAWLIPGMAEPELPISPTLSVRWEPEQTSFAPMGLEGPLPLSPHELSDEVLTRISTDSIGFIPRSIASLMSVRRLGRGLKNRSAPKVESLETVRLLSGCPSISGFVYLDANNDGLFESGETPIAGNPIELLNSSGVVVGQATTDATGAYSFMTDSTISQATQTVTQTASVPSQPTNFTSDLTLPQFDSSLGTLTQVDVTVSGMMASDIKSENTSTSSPTTITATVSGLMTLTSPVSGLDISAPGSAIAGTYDAATFGGGPITYSAPSGHDFGTATAPFQQTASFKTSAGDDLSGFVGSGTFALTFAADATSGASGGGNLQTEANSSVSANVAVTYYYTPTNCLSPGNYTIVQEQEPPGTLNGKDSSNGIVFPPNTTGDPDKIPVTLGTSNLPNNDFGQLLPGTVSGFVYQDTNNDGLKEPGEAGIPNLPVELTGTNDLGPITPIDGTTAADGSYDFTNLRPGTYTVTELQQPSGYLDGLDTRGNVVPLPNSNTTDFIPGIGIAFGQTAPEQQQLRRGPARNAVSGSVYWDKNNDGLEETGEPGISGVPVELTGTNDLGPITPEFATTNTNGAYSFNLLRPGTYTVTETQQPSGYLDGLDTRGNLTPIPGSNKTDDIPGITLALGQSRAEQ